MTEPPPRSPKFEAFIVAAIMVALAAMFAFSWTDNSTDITPGHTEATLIAGLVAALITSAVALILLLWLRPPLRKPRFVTAPLLALMSGFMAGILTFNASDRLIQLFEFRGDVIRFDREYPIFRAYISHGKGVSYHIQLTDPFTDFSLSPSDYTNTFGNSEELSPAGYCLQARVEQSGEAIRIMYPSARAIPPGRVRRCSAQVSAQ